MKMNAKSINEKTKDMQYLFKDQNRGWLKEILESKHLMLFLDCDGTLTPIAEAPAEAELSSETRNILEKLKGCGSVEIAIVSGRGLADVKRLVGIKDIIYVGNHGFEIEGPAIKFESLATPRLKEVLRELSAKLEEVLKPIGGVIIEDKGLSLSIHYRKVTEKNIPFVEKTVYSVIRPYLSRKEILLGKGKMVIEVRPPLEWDKGKAIQWVLSQKQHTFPREMIYPVSIGDDITDEDAFLAVSGHGLAVFVGQPRPSHAKYFLNDPKDVFQFLNEILTLKSHGTVRHSN